MNDDYNLYGNFTENFDEFINQVETFVLDNRVLVDIDVVLQSVLYQIEVAKMLADYGVISASALQGMLSVYDVLLAIRNAAFAKHAESWVPDSLDSLDDRE